MFQGFSAETVDFMWGIRFNNEKSWFEEHKREYLTYFQAPMRALAGEGRAVVLVMHDIDLAARFCDRLAVLRKGRLYADGSPAAVLTPAMLREVYGVSGVVQRDPYPHFVPD